MLGIPGSFFSAILPESHQCVSRQADTINSGWRMQAYLWHGRRRCPPGAPCGDARAPSSRSCASCAASSACSGVLFGHAHDHAIGSCQPPRFPPHRSDAWTGGRTLVQRHVVRASTATTTQQRTHKNELAVSGPSCGVPAQRTVLLSDLGTDLSDREVFRSLRASFAPEGAGAEQDGAVPGTAGVHPDRQWPVGVCRRSPVRNICTIFIHNASWVKAHACGCVCACRSCDATPPPVKTDGPQPTPSAPKLPPIFGYSNSVIAAVRCRSSFPGQAAREARVLTPSVDASWRYGDGAQTLSPKAALHGQPFDVALDNLHFAGRPLSLTASKVLHCSRTMIAAFASGWTDRL